MVIWTWEHVGGEVQSRSPSLGQSGRSKYHPLYMWILLCKAQSPEQRSLL